MNPDDLPDIAHDPAAFEAYYRAHCEQVLRFVARRVDDPELAADLTAEVFLAAIEAASSYRASRGTPTAWTYGIARVVVSAERRRSAREARACARVVGRRLLDEDDVVLLQERIDAAAQSRALYAGLSALGEGERAVVELVALDGLAVSEAAAVLGIRPVTARVRMHRARAVLRGYVLDDDRSTITRPLEARS